MCACLWTRDLHSPPVFFPLHAAPFMCLPANFLFPGYGSSNFHMLTQLKSPCPRHFRSCTSIHRFLSSWLMLHVIGSLLLSQSCTKLPCQLPASSMVPANHSHPCTQAFDSFFRVAFTGLLSGSSLQSHKPQRSHCSHKIRPVTFR